MPKVETFNRDQVLENVIQLFHEKGYSATSMQDLVDATGLNRSSIYNSFGNKKELYQESLKKYRATAHKYIQKVLIHSNDPKDSIRRIFSTSPETKNNGCLLSNCTTEMANQDREIRSFLVNNLEHMQGIFEELVAKGQSDGSINTLKSAKVYAMYLFTSLQGLRITGVLLNEPKDIDSIVETTLSILN
ncbi:MAG: TetR/AcrR family transcriptional regulator [Flavobacteriaceae bacterium]